MQCHYSVSDKPHPSRQVDVNWCRAALDAALKVMYFLVIDRSLDSGTCPSGPSLETPWKEPSPILICTCMLLSLSTPGRPRCGCRYEWIREVSIMYRTFLAWFLGHIFVQCLWPFLTLSCRCVYVVSAQVTTKVRRDGGRRMFLLRDAAYGFGQ